MCDALEHDLLCRLAYQAWLARGQPHGSPEADWQCAQRQVTPLLSIPAPEMLDATNDA